MKIRDRLSTASSLSMAHVRHALLTPQTVSVSFTYGRHLLERVISGFHAFSFIRISQ